LSCGPQPISNIGDGRARSALSIQRSASERHALDFRYFTLQNSFAKRKEVTDKESIPPSTIGLLSRLFFY
jgi:hypothetical protein